MDWILRYGNEKLAGVECVPLTGLIGNTELKIICFPTFSGHCGCMLFPLDEIHCVQKQDELSEIWKNYLLKQE